MVTHKQFWISKSFSPKILWKKATFRRSRLFTPKDLLLLHSKSSFAKLVLLRRSIGDSLKEIFDKSACGDTTFGVIKKKRYMFPMTIMTIVWVFLLCSGAILLTIALDSELQHQCTMYWSRAKEKPFLLVAGSTS